VDLAVLTQGEPLALEGADPAQPGPAFGQELVLGMNGYSEHSRSAVTETVYHQQLRPPIEDAATAMNRIFPARDA
jgi:hypothetical protein